jgi:hypothetical protein
LQIKLILFIYRTGLAIWFVQPRRDLYAQSKVRISFVVAMGSVLTRQRGARSAGLQGKPGRPLSSEGSATPASTSGPRAFARSRSARRLCPSSSRCSPTRLRYTTHDTHARTHTHTHATHNTHARTQSHTRHAQV